jgi:UDP-2,3-diacylglucosamine pyrophosphatase LpxH
MMQVSFDLISDLHIETWPEPFDWTGMATSMIAVVAGDISRDRNTVINTLQHLSECYKAVIYVDGNDEHRWRLDDLSNSYRELVEELAKIENVVYLQDNVAVIDGVGFVGTNAWWTYDFDNEESYDSSKRWYADRYKIDLATATSIEAMALQDTQYLTKSIKKLQTHQDVKQLVIVTHTPPDVELIQHDVELEGTHMLNCSGNSHILKSVSEDTEGKIHTWCFGHYHGDVDRELYGIRFVNNCRGRGDTPWSKSVYHPKKITVKI